MKIKFSVPAVFMLTSGVVFVLGAYLLATKTSLHPQLFITTCGEVLKNVWENTHFNPDGVVSSLVLITATIGTGLTLWQLTRFFMAHRRLHQLKTLESIPDKLKWVIRKHNLTEESVLLISSGKQTAYTIGLFKPQIVVSFGLIRKLSKEQLEAVILHELYHLKSRHILWLLASRLISSLFFFIPLIGYLARELRTEFELAADAFVVDKQKTADHLCDSLALNLQYADGVIPHFATSPIERRVESLVGNKLSFEWIGLKPLAASIFSLTLMLGIAFIQPSQVTAEFAYEVGGVCSVKEGCQTTDCSSHKTKDTHNFSPLIPASFSLLSSY